MDSLESVFDVAIIGTGMAQSIAAALVYLLRSQG